LFFRVEIERLGADHGNWDTDERREQIEKADLHSNRCWLLWEIVSTEITHRYNRYFCIFNDSLNIPETKGTNFLYWCRRYPRETCCHFDKLLWGRYPLPRIHLADNTQNSGNHPPQNQLSAIPQDIAMGGSVRVVPCPEDGWYHQIFRRSMSTFCVRVGKFEGVSMFDVR
jgi:hypothetical protein